MLSNIIQIYYSEVFWLTSFSDAFFLQLLMFYLLYLLINIVNIYYMIFYFFLFCFYLGIVLAINQLDLFTGFLWLIECVLIFAFLLLVFFVKPVTFFSYFNFNINKYSYSVITFLAFLAYLGNLTYQYNEAYHLNWLNFIDLWDDYYEALNNTNINDFTGFLISYYNLNSFEFILFGLIILIVSLICVNLNKKLKYNRIKSIDNILQIVNFFKKSLDFIFLRQQNMVDQNSTIAATRIFKKKKK